MAYKVIQWAPGYIGAAALKAIIEHPELNLVGVFAYSEDKVGVDAGELAGTAPTGILATSSYDEMVALDADVVVHCASGRGPIAERDEHVLGLLRSGKNVISTMAYAAPWVHGGKYEAALLDACRAGNASLMGGGMNPDCVNGCIAAGLTRMCTEVKHVSVIEIDDMSLDPHEDFVVGTLGIGKTPGDFAPDMDAVQYMLWVIPEIPSLLARNLGASVEISNMGFEFYKATRDLEIAVGTIREGSICGARLMLDGMRDGEPFVHVEVIYGVEREHPDFPQIPFDTRYVIEIEGTPSLRTTIDIAPTLDESVPRKVEDIQAVMLATAASAVNAIPSVCAADAGLFRMPVPGARRVTPAAGDRQPVAPA